MAFDKSGTRNRVILIVAFGTVIGLGALKFVFDSYFISMAEASAQEKLASPEALIRLREEEKKALENAPIPIDQAMSRVAAGREGAGAAIAPQLCATILASAVQEHERAAGAWHADQ